MNENKFNLPESWNKDYQKELRTEVLRYLDRFFYDGPFDEDILMKNMMRASGGKVNPHQMKSIIQDFIEEYK